MFTVPSVEEVEKERNSRPAINLFKSKKEADTQRETHTQNTAPQAETYKQREADTQREPDTQRETVTHSNVISIDSKPSPFQRDTKLAKNVSDLPFSSTSLVAAQTLIEQPGNQPNASSAIDTAVIQAHAAVPSAVSATPAFRGNPNVVVVNTRQKGNPVLKAVRNVAWEYGDILPDYVLGQNTCVVYLSMRYHLFRKEYIHQRIRELGRMYKLRILLLHIDVEQFKEALLDLTAAATLNQWTLLLAWSVEEAARYIETLKIYEHKPADLLKGQHDNSYLAKATEMLTAIKSINKTDVVTLLSTFGSVKDIATAQTAELSLCPGFGDLKVQRLHEVFNEPFIASRKKPKILSETPALIEESIPRSQALIGGADDISDAESLLDYDSE